MLNPPPAVPLPHPPLAPVTLPAPAVRRRPVVVAGAALLATLAVALAVALQAGPTLQASAPGSRSLLIAALWGLLVVLCGGAWGLGRTIRAQRVVLDSQALQLRRLKLVADQSPLALMWAALPVGVLVHDAEGRVVDANPVAEGAPGRAVLELQQRDPADPRWHAVAADLGPLAAADHPVQRTLDSGRPLRGELLGMQTADGTLHWLRVNTEAQRDARGQVIGVVSCFIDITGPPDLQAGAARAAPAPRGDAASRPEDRGAVLEHEIARGDAPRDMLARPARSARSATCDELLRALEADELHAVYQPMVTLADGSLVGVEASLRWRHPTRGLIEPQALIETAQACDLSDAVVDRVLHEACLQFMQWQPALGAGASMLLAVNLCSVRPDHPGLPAAVAAALARAGMPPGQLQIEFSARSNALEERHAGALAALRARGVRLALDDFGSGESSLARLHEADLDTVKIDGSFVRRSDLRANHRMLIEATVSVARARGMKTLAKGIGTAAEAASMAELGCDQGQGDLWARPMTAAAMTTWLREPLGDR